jgi:uncharacterized protein (DUF2384 family)
VPGQGRARRDLARMPEIACWLLVLAPQGPSQTQPRARSPQETWQRRQVCMHAVSTERESRVLAAHSLHRPQTSTRVCPRSAFLSCGPATLPYGPQHRPRRSSAPSQTRPAAARGTCWRRRPMRHTHTHAHTHTLSLSLSLCVCVLCVCVCVCVCVLHKQASNLESAYAHTRRCRCG